ncbi:TauD/TfdA family dioxygenase [Agrilutibacter solisilvae]|uniref:TauD/TfdA family dioxygenase n=1 Tax=Agrilutibacter solisilvae TaxID=2763317 RepID=A0A974Y365_9GAMM|nr:TauD/TfdA family dioxygenase [Lysobacter solisilvae]QSX79620.1 TauD/TfdA family dioxygenase [Lysobacter solisilvae]
MKMNPLFSTSTHHPVVITPGADSSLGALHEYVSQNQPEIQRLLLQHGGLLFRGFGLNGAEDFHACSQSLGARPFGYVGGDSPRNRVVADVFTSTEYPATEVISLHNEMSYLPSWPTRLFFYSHIPASTGGQTSLANSGDVLRALPQEIVDKFRAKKVNYIRNFQSKIPFGKSWQATYQTQDRAEVEQIAAEQGSVCTWTDDGTLRVSTRCDAFATHPQTGEEVWFNQAEQWHASSLNPAIRGMFEQMVGKGNLPHECEYGDGEPMDEQTLAEVRRILDSNKLLFDWQRGDLLVIDNILMMHGRESFKGERKTLAYLSST